MNATATPPARVPLEQIRQAGADHIAEQLHRALPAEHRETSGGFNSAI